MTPKISINIIMNQNIVMSEIKTQLQFCTHIPSTILYKSYDVGVGT